MRNQFAPSRWAASDSDGGMPRKNCRRVNTARPLPSPGRISASSVLASPQSENVRDSGMAIASNGIRKLRTTIVNTTPR